MKHKSPKSASSKEYGRLSFDRGVLLQRAIAVVVWLLFAGSSALGQTKPSEYQVEAACDGQEALRIIEQTQPELLLLDIGMPVMDGFAVIRRTRENPRLAKLPVVAITAYAMRGDQERILNSGFDGYLSKPVTSSSLASELDRVLTQGNHAANPDRVQEGQSPKKARAGGATGSAT